MRFLCGFGHIEKNHLRVYIATVTGICVGSQGNVREKSGNFCLPTPWQPCIWKWGNFRVVKVEIMVNQIKSGHGREVQFLKLNWLHIHAFNPLMFYFVSVTAISHVRSHFTHTRSVYRQISWAYFAKLLQHKINGVGWGCCGGDGWGYGWYISHKYISHNFTAPNGSSFAFVLITFFHIW